MLINVFTVFVDVANLFYQAPVVTFSGAQTGPGEAVGPGADVNATVLVPNIVACDGLIHIVDDVRAAPFTALAAALTTVSLTSTRLLCQ